MCHNSVFENEQIEKCIENGMPEKLRKTIKYTMRKRANDSNSKNQLIKLQQQQQQEQEKKENKNFVNEISSQQQQQQKQTFISKCPFGHGKLSIPSSTPFAKTFLTTADNTTTTVAATNLTDELNLSLKSTNNNNNIFLKHFSQISQLSTKITEEYIDESSSINNLSGQCKDNKIYNEDILAKSTQLTREFAYIVQQAIRGLQNSKIYT